MASNCRRIDGQALMYLKCETAENVPMTGVATVLDGILSKEELCLLINNRLLADPKYFRFKSIVTDCGYFEELRDFDSKDVLNVFNISENSRLEEALSLHINQHHNHAFDKQDCLPLWRGHILHFADLNQTIFYLKSHHVICDGISLSKVFLSLADNFDEISAKEMELIRESNAYQAYKHRWNQPIFYTIYVTINCIFWLIHIISLLYCHSEKASIINPTEYNSNKSFFTLCNISLEAINKVRKSAPYREQNVTINDYLLAILSDAISRFLADYDATYDIKAGAAISMNGRDPISLTSETDIDCCVGVSQINIPLSFGMSIERKVKYVKQQMDTIKTRQYAMFSAVMLRFTGYLPQFIIPFLMKLQDATMLVSNVRGPKSTLYLNDHRIISVTGVVQNAPGISLSFCIASYDGKCSISLLSDYNIIGHKTSQTILQYVHYVLCQEGILCADNVDFNAVTPQFDASKRKNTRHAYSLLSRKQTVATLLFGSMFIAFCSYIISNCF